MKMHTTQVGPRIGRLPIEQRRGFRVDVEKGNQWVGRNTLRFPDNNLSKLPTLSAGASTRESVAPLAISPDLQARLG